MRFLVFAVLLGFFVGIGEGLLLFFFQHPEIFPDHLVGPAILLLAPLVDALAFGVLGGTLEIRPGTRVFQPTVGVA
jgi:hypothetical protein